MRPKEAGDSSYTTKPVYLLYTVNCKARWVKIDLDCIPRTPPISPPPKYLVGPNKHIGPFPQSEEVIISLKPVAVPEMQSPPTQNYLPMCGHVCLNSKMYAIGGCDFDNIADFCYNTKVSIFDLSTNKWEESAMQFPRASPTVVAIENIIYVFGGRGSDQHRIPKEKWGEFYDTKTDQWDFLPATPQRVADSHINLHAVYEHRHWILFWLHGVGILSYDYVNKTWSDPLEYPALDEVFLRMHYAVAVVDDILFWHYCGTIHAYDLFNKHHLFSQELDKSLASFGEGFYGYMPDPNYLVRVGKDTLLLLFWDYSNTHGRRFQCHKFQIAKSSNANAQGGGCGDVLCLLPDGCGFFDLAEDSGTAKPKNLVVA